MKVDISLSNARVYDISRADIIKGQKFSLLTDAPDGSTWYADNDPVLSLKVNGSSATVSADAVGTSSILIMDSNRSILKELIISVVDAVVPLATQLGLTADAPVQK
jgi:hypothetical protein